MLVEVKKLKRCVHGLMIFEREVKASRIYLFIYLFILSRALCEELINVLCSALYFGDFINILVVEVEVVVLLNY